MNHITYAGLPVHVKDLYLGGGQILNFKKEMVSVLLQNACNLVGCEYEQLLKGRRLSEIVKAKRLFFHFMRTHTSDSLEKIASYIGCDHATVIHHVKTCKGYLDINDKEYTLLVKQYKKLNQNLLIYWFITYFSKKNNEKITHYQSSFNARG